jgi:putative transposase
MARLPRSFVPGFPVHLIQRGNNRQRVFVDDADRRLYLRLLEQESADNSVPLHAFVLMPNHVHLLATPGEVNAIPRMMQVLNTRCAMRFNHRHSRTGGLWEGRYRAAIVESERYLLACVRYIELNPVRAGLVARPGDYPWSSYSANAQSEGPLWLSQHSVFRELGTSEASRQRAYRLLFVDVVDQQLLSTIRRATGYVLGSAAFCREVEHVTGTRADRGRRGPARGTKYSASTKCLGSDPKHLR